MGGVWELDLDPAKKLVLLAMADHADHEGRNVHPSLPLIAWKTGYSPRQVQRIVHELTDAGILEIQEVGTGRGKPTHYRISLEKGVKMSPFVRGKGCQDVAVSPEKGDICDSERVTSGTVKGDIAMSPEPLREPSIEVVVSNGHSTDERPTYPATLGKQWQTVVKNYQRLHPTELNEPGLKSILFEVEKQVGVLTQDELWNGLGAAWEAIKSALQSEREGKIRIGALRRYCRPIIAERLAEARHA